MKSGDIVFIKGKSPISWLIRLFDKGKFSHCAICISNNAILEAQYYTKSRIVPFYFKDYEIIDLCLTDEQRKRIQELSLNLIGYYYDYKQIWSYFIRVVWNKKLKIYNSPNNYICSEIIEFLLQEIGVIPDEKELRNMTPNQLYEYLKSIKN